MRGVTWERVVPALAAVAVAIIAWNFLRIYRVHRADDREIALRRLKGAIAALGADESDSGNRLDQYLTELDGATAALRTAVVRYPGDAVLLSQLAATLWESSSIHGKPDGPGVLALIALSASRAPRNPEIQADLGNVLYRMGRHEEARQLMRRALTLSPGITNRVVAMTLDAGISPAGVLDELPQTDGVLIALKGPMLAAQQGNRFLDVAEEHLASASPELLATYGEACLQLHHPLRLKDAVQKLPPSDDPGLRAERDCQLAHAWVSLGDAETALPFATSAKELRPDDPQVLALFGEVALLARASTEAEAAFRRSIELVIAEGGDPIRRARLYDALGRTLESEGRADEAYDAFRRAAALDPSDPGPAARVEAYERSAHTVTP